MEDRGIEVGERAPGFELPAARGGTVTLEELLGGPVIVLFYRGSW